MIPPNTDKNQNLTSELRESVCQLNQSFKDSEEFKLGLFRSIKILHWVGYGLLVLALFDLIVILFPPGFMNPFWEFKMFGEVVEIIPVPLLGFSLVFLGEAKDRTNREKHLLKFLSRFTLWSGFMLLLLIPLAIINTVRIEASYSSQLTSKFSNRKAQIEEVQKQLEKVKTPEEMQALVNRLDSQGRTPAIKNAEEVEQVKHKISSFMEKSANTMESQVAKTLSSQRQNLLKNSVKWNLGALVGGVLFFMIWRGTGWARRSRKKKSKVNSHWLTDKSIN
ncbi:MAG: hypothetical protein F6K56_06520 [Moorea sp. SIO3G5]|nr:hypothetical protein [Moorena sp. SIO3G5]